MTMSHTDFPPPRKTVREILHPTGLGTCTPSFDINRFRELETVPAEEVREKADALA